MPIASAGLLKRYSNFLSLNFRRLLFINYDSLLKLPKNFMDPALPSTFTELRSLDPTVTTRAISFTKLKTNKCAIAHSYASYLSTLN